MQTPTIYVSCGDVNGIGLHCLGLVLHNHPSIADTLTLVTHPATLAEACDRYRIHLPVNVLPTKHYSPVTPGVATQSAALLAMESLELAIEHCKQSPTSGIVTLPIHKKSLSDRGWPYPGQTEMLAAHCDGTPLMVLCQESLRIALATIHVPLRSVPSLITSEHVQQQLMLLHQHLVHDVGISAPNIAVLGLNPHAGEGGLIGSEELTTLQPAIQQLTLRGIHVHGPFSADGFFGFGDYLGYDGILAMYHDQGLIALKSIAGGAGVNVTAGLSIVRTSPDHGTAHHLAGSGALPDFRSTEAALRLCNEIVMRRSSMR